MKKLLLFVAIIIVACSNEKYIDDIRTQVPVKQVSNLRSYEEALQVAESSISMLDNSESTRSSSSRKIDANNSKVYLNKSVTRSSSNTSDTLMYVFNFEDNEGFAIVAAPKDIKPLIAITEKGHYDPDEPSGIEGFDDYMNLAEKYIMGNRGGGAGDPLIGPIYLSESVTDITTVGPYVTVRWGQRCPEGDFCSNGYSGCTNTAMAQIMSYYEHPSSIALTYNGHDINTQTLNWTSIKSHTPEENPLFYIMCPDTTTHYAISRLLRQLGQMSNSSYGPNGTGTQILFAKSALNNLGYTVGTWLFYNTATVQSVINNGHLFLIYASTSGNDAHCWVLDGYKIVVITTTFYINTGLGDPIIDRIETQTYNYNHFNWGWYGENNGYFLENVFDTSSVTYPDTNNNSYNYNFNVNVELREVYL